MVIQYDLIALAVLLELFRNHIYCLNNEKGQVTRIIHLAPVKSRESKGRKRQKIMEIKVMAWTERHKYVAGFNQI